jgi:hypothetical protein
MAFAHFHRHKSKYLVISFVAMVFSLLAFNITSALNDLAARAFGRSTGRFVFTTSSGRSVSVEDDTLRLARAELPGALAVFIQVGGSDPYDGIDGGENRAYAHQILLAEAEEMGIAASAGRVAGMVEGFKQFIQQRNPTKAVKLDEYRRILGGELRLTEARLDLRLSELCQVEAYVRAMKGGRVHQPQRLVQLATPRATKVALDWIELPYAKFKDELAAAPPPDTELETWFKGLAADVIEEKYTRGERFSIEMALVETAAWDPASVATELVAKVELTDEEFLSEGKRDALRYFGDREKVPAKIEDVTPEARAAILKDRQLKAVFERLRGDFDAAVAALAALPEPAAPEADEATRTAAEEARNKALLERTAAETAEFAKVAARYGFAVNAFTDLESAALAELDPPKHSSLQFLVRGIAAPGASGIRTQLVLPNGDQKHGFVVRLADATKKKEPKPFAEVRDAALAQWIEEHAREKAEAKGKEFLAALLAENEKAVASEVLAAYRAERDRLTAEINDDKSLDEEARKLRLEGAGSPAAQYTGWIAGHLGARYGASFRPVAASLALEVRSSGPHRRDVSSSWYYNDRFSGGERHLFRQNRFAVSVQDASVASLLSMGTGAVLDEVLVDDANGACYVASVAARTLPTLADLTPKDRQQAERDLESEWNRLDNPFMRRFNPVSTPSCENPFAMVHLARRHHPKLRINDPAQAAPSSPYGYN